MKLGKFLKVYQLPEELASEQHYVDRAEEEDLFTGTPVIIEDCITALLQAACRARRI